MRHSPTARCLVLLACLAPLAPAGATLLRITATNVRNDDGSIVVLVYDSADRWLSERWRSRKLVAVASHRVDDTVTLEFDLPPGQYAFSVFQDSDDNSRLARNFLGMPREPAGLSNNLRPRLGPPRYRDAVFTLGDQPLEQRIRLE